MDLNATILCRLRRGLSGERETRLAHHLALTSVHSCRCVVLGYRQPQMSERAINWLMFTCGLGLLPLLARLVVWLISTNSVEPIATGDLVAFGLVLHSANINEVNRASNKDDKFRSVHVGVSILFLVVYSILLYATIDSAGRNLSTVLVIATLMAVFTFILSFSVMLEERMGAVHRE